MLHKTRLHKHNTITRLELASAATAPEEKGRVVDGQVQDDAVARARVDDVVLVGVVEEHDLPLDPGARPRRARDRQREPVDVGRVDVAAAWTFLADFILWFSLWKWLRTASTVFSIS